MRKLFLNNNHLNGELPSELGDFTSLIAIDLTQNQLTGCGPKGLKGFDYVGLPPCIAPLATLPRTAATLKDAGPTPAPTHGQWPTATLLPMVRPVVTISPTATPGIPQGNKIRANCHTYPHIYAYANTDGRSGGLRPAG